MTDFEQRLADRTLRTVVIGCGYVGSRVRSVLTEEGLPVKGYDLAPDRSDFASLDEALDWGDVRIVCVGTGLDAARLPDTSAVASVLARCQEKPALLTALESTVTPGFCHRHWSDEEQPFVFLPERIWPAGEPTWNLRNIPRLIAGNSRTALSRAILLYRRWVPMFVPVSFTVAELAKCYENTQRAVNILLAHDLRTICESLGQRVDQVLDACNTKPFGYVHYYPGEIGGECIPMAPAFLGGWRYLPIVTAAEHAMSLHQAKREEKEQKSNDPVTA